MKTIPPSPRALLAALLLSLALSPAHAGLLGQQINEAAQKATAAHLAKNPEYASASPARKKIIANETLLDMTRREMDRVENDLQRKIDKKIQGVINTVLIKALPDTDKRIPEIKRMFLAQMYIDMNESEDSNTFYNLYDSASGNGLGASVETIIYISITADQTLTSSDIDNVIRALSPRLNPPLNEMEITLITNAIYGGLMAIR